ncbi:hypothetical protein K402DRAFT_425778 [Aulographum hederae CBS 113979]|uniref:Uncharacterized protein n=1 Tax=Aulographum hederae CBS 113979 TaxID=1176131 RepID=A0A6G1GJI0_9PEZI|nr:hypothetical protein K402DRAFT_425778 [Aulographum hederae CBS 113979]
MKASTILLLAAAIVNAAVVPTAPAPNANAADKRQILGGITSLAGKGGKVPDPAGASPRRVELGSNSTKAGLGQAHPGQKVVKLREGPYSVINMNKMSLTGEAGALWNYPDVGVSKPCEGNCTIIGLQAGLEYPDGTNANIDSGMWLHHMVFLVKGPGRVDATCENHRGVSLPHLDVGATPQTSERLFSSGNERTPLIVPKDVKAGYKINDKDQFAFIVDLMNDNMEDKVVYLTMTYTILDGHPEDYETFRPVWFDVNQCGTSEVPSPQPDGAFTIQSQPWTPTFEGRVLGLAGHLHDGGTNLQVKTQRANVCNSTTTYAGSPEFIPKAGGMGDMGGMEEGEHSDEEAAPAAGESESMPGMDMGGEEEAGHSHGGMARRDGGHGVEHISNMKSCYGMKWGNNEVAGIQDLKKTDTWTIVGHYDYNEHPGAKHGGSDKPANIMGIAIMFVIENL